MKIFRMLLGVLVAGLPLVVCAQPARAPVAYEAPAGNVAAGRLGTNPFWAVLPSGRLVKPTGRSAVVGIGALGVALSPDGRFAIVSNGDDRMAAARSMLDPSIAGGYSLTVVDTETMRAVSQYAPRGVSYFSGVIATRDPSDPSRTLVVASGGPANALYFLNLDANGRLVPDRVRALLPIVGEAAPSFADLGRSFPGSLVLAPGGTVAYAVNNLAGSVTAIDLRSRSVRATRPVGFFPFGATVAKNELLVCNEGLMRYARLAETTAAPPFRTPSGDIERASSLSLVPLDGAGNVSDNLPGLPPPFLSMDRPPDGVRIVGGAHPRAVVADADAKYAYVAMAGIDRVVVVSLEGTPRVLGGLDLRLFPRGPYGTQPAALALSHDGKRLYVALAGLDAIAVIDASDPLNLKRLGLIPTGWYPSSLALSNDDRTLYVTNAKGFGPDPGFRGDAPLVVAPDGRVLTVGVDSAAVWSTLQRIDLTGLDMVHETYTTLGSTRNPKTGPRSAIVPSLGEGASRAIKHVVVILESSKTFDAMLGDLTGSDGRPHGNADPSLVAFGASVTPNLHALARSYGLADNLYADAQDTSSAHQFALGGIASDYSERRRPFGGGNANPEDYPRFGYIFNTLALHNISFRNYGGLLRLAGYDDGMNPDPRVDDPGFVSIEDRFAPTSGFGGRYALDVPGLAALNGRVDERYPGWNLRIRDERRAREFVRDFDRLGTANALPRFTFVWLPSNHGGSGPLVPPLAEEVADGDRALGIIVSHISHMPMWKDTAIFIMPDDSEASRDHVSVERTFAVVVSPYAKRGYVGHRHLSTASVLKTEEELLGLPPLALGDLLATDLSDFFAPQPRFEPYVSKPVPAQTARFGGFAVVRRTRGE